MTDEPAVQFLRGVLHRLRSQPWERERFDAPGGEAERTATLDRLGAMLSPGGAEGIGAEGLVVLLREMKKHSKVGHGRGVPNAADLGPLREALAILVDDRLTVPERLDRLRPPGGKALVKGLGPSVITSILHLLDPERYGVLSGTSEGVLRRLGVYPEFPVSASLAVRYEAVNAVMVRLAKGLGISLGDLEYLLWRVQPQALADFAPVPQARAR